MTMTKTRIAIYARSSRDGQTENVIEDQVDRCRAFVEKECGTVIEVFQDVAASGASGDRPGLLALRAHAEQFDLVVADTSDRISRDQSMFAVIRKDLELAGCMLATISEGRIDDPNSGFSATMSRPHLANSRDSL